MIIDDDDDYSLSHHHHHHHHQLPAAYLQLSVGKTGQDSPPMSPPGDGRTLSEPGTLTPGCAYCAVPTAAVGPDCTGDRATSTGDSDRLTCVRCGHEHRVHLFNHSDSSDYVSGQHLHHCQLQQQQQQDVI